MTSLNFNLSAVVCILAATYGFRILIKHLHIARRDMRTVACDALPVILGTLSWATAALIFLEMPASYSSPIELQRVFMVITWCWLISRYRRCKTKRLRPRN